MPPDHHLAKTQCITIQIYCHLLRTVLHTIVQIFYKSGRQALAHTAEAQRAEPFTESSIKAGTASMEVHDRRACWGLLDSTP